MLRYFFIGLSFVLLCPAVAQQSSNMTLLGRYDDNSLPVYDGVVYNDIWGYTTGGREYAIVGSLYKVHFMEVTDPGNIQEVAAIEADIGSNFSIWRDIKTFGNYAYAVADQAVTDEGLLVFDMSNINGPDPVGAGDPERVTLVRQLRSEFTEAHNIYVDTDNGILYAVGVNVAGVDMVVYDLNADPSNPTLIRNVELNGGYVHDVYVENHRAYCSHLGSGLYVYDMSPVTNPGANPPGSPIELGIINGYPYNILNHSSWVSGNTMVFADERHGSPLKIADISNLNLIEIQDYFYSNLLGLANPFSPSNPRGPIAHNPFIIGNYVYVSYYHDGVSVFDISDPTDVVQVGYYDTEPNNTNYNGYEGCWGVYPFLPSGNIIASDVLNGLHVLEFSAALPVEWETFTAKAQTEDVRLDWSTRNQENNAGFTVQRQQPNGEWKEIGWQPANVEQRYRFIDESPWSGWNIYRLVQQDFDGTKDYSEWQSVYFEGKSTSWQISPNPVQSGGDVFVSGGEQAGTLWQIYNAIGIALWEGEGAYEAGRTRLRLPHLPAGYYWLRAANSDTAMSFMLR